MRLCCEAANPSVAERLVEGTGKLCFLFWELARAGHLKGGSKTCAAAMPRNALALCLVFRAGLALCKRSCNRDCQQPVRRRLEQSVLGCLQQSRWGRHVWQSAGSRLSNAEAIFCRRRQRRLCRRSHQRAKTRTAIQQTSIDVLTQYLALEAELFARTAVSSKSTDISSAQEEGYDFGLEEVPTHCRKGDGCSM